MVLRINRAEDAATTKYFDFNKRLFSCQVGFYIMVHKSCFVGRELFQKTDICLCCFDSDNQIEELSLRTAVAKKKNAQIEGMFKTRICTNNVFTRVSFTKRLKFPEAAKIALKIHKAVGPFKFTHHTFHNISCQYLQLRPGLRENLQSDAPFAMENTIATCQTMEVRVPEVPGELGPWRFSGGEELAENSALLLPASQRKNWSSKERKRYFAKELHRKEVYFDPAFVYTFDLHSSVVDLVPLELRIAGTTFQLAKYLNQQPIWFALGRKCRVRVSSAACWCVQVHRVSSVYRHRNGS